VPVAKRNKYRHKAKAIQALCSVFSITTRRLSSILVTVTTIKHIATFHCFSPFGLEVVCPSYGILGGSKFCKVIEEPDLTIYLDYNHRHLVIGIGFIG
jgi:hypothetical protein